MAAGVSGGPHSLALALIAQDFCRAQGGSLLALVVDHGFRAESAAEARWTAGTLAARGIAARVISLGLPRGAALQERARAGRMAAMLSVCASDGYPWLLLGQHRLDQAETLLFRALRGSGEAGLAGMAAARAAPEAMILRPLLGTPPAALEALLAARGILPLRDPSNDDPRFARVRLRRSLADPGGEGQGTAALAEAARAFARRRAAAEEAAAARLAGVARIDPAGWAFLPPGALGADRVAVASLAALVRLLSGDEHAPSTAATRALLARGEGTLHGVHWQGGWLVREPVACAPPVPALDGAAWDGRWRLRGHPPDGFLLGALGAARAGGLDRKRRRGWPARLLAGLPALWHPGDPAAAPSIPALEDGPGTPFRLDFCPAGGAISGYKGLENKNGER
ncbi:tRNA lysidine(34) synthetase TilS [Teichococcus deserti]|uniref:tRNA lysidine(34) synthetase TilS n=1 Tax=Teichococcus deserti TaxID=1817963 RepID=UPI0024186B1F|nr:tRNA lysidine(34) synthetase TilS [Pseudoroseomonas deserti]